MSSKLGAHFNFVTEPDVMRDFLLQPGVMVAKTLHHDPGFWGEIKAERPDLFLVGRKYFDDQDYDNPEGDADRAARRVLDMRTAHIMDCWEAYNEVSGHVDSRYCRFERQFAQRLHEAGVKYLCGSKSVGTPPIEEWTKPEHLDVLRVADYIGVHEYCAPRMDSEFLRHPDDPDIKPEVGGYFTLRYRKWWPTLPADCRKPVVISECGIDSGAAHWDPGAQGGWRSFTDAQGYLEQLAWYDGFLQQDKYVIGATIFCWGTIDPRWDTFDLKGEMKDLLAQYIEEQRTVEEPTIEEFEAWLSGYAQQHVIPYNLKAAFRGIQRAQGWKEALSDEVSLNDADVDADVPEKFKEKFGGVRFQVFVQPEHGLVAMQQIVWAHVDHWDQWRVIKRPN